MATKPLKRPRDPIALAKLIGDIATGQVEDKTEDKSLDAVIETPDDEEEVEAVAEVAHACLEQVREVLQPDLAARQ